MKGLKSMVTINNVSFEYNNEEKILEDSSLEFTSNKITIILGKNGVGKTTLLSLIDGFLTPDSGNILKEEDCAFIYDTPHLYEYLTGFEYLELLKRLKADHELFQIDELMETLELTENMSKEILTFSLGMKHKLALLSAIMLNYKLYLIDEPLAALDPESQNFMINFLIGMKEKGNTLIISTHMLNVAYKLADEFVIFRDNKLVKHENNFESYNDFEEFVLNSLKVTL